MAATSHQYVAVVLAVEGMFANVGGAVGETVASAIWTGVFPHRLREFLPQDMKSEWATIYEDLTEQLSYPIGSPTRTAIIEAYGATQRLMLIASTTVLVLAVAAVIVRRDINVKNHKQVKGRVW
ncbi:MFS siderochrome iron transporter 1 [Extremus antarcticus]|uniref:MFS siderochrome iron transporter 1 n=1 Tax=Extremus antarcticus TaxID=702011 RepID=A0AAJ0GEX7_9PEZI|nr:MFS siderochrome iron transporter 1 [Extremus antarcticus]